MTHCNHEYSEGWWNKTTWHCMHPAGHKGWHHAPNRTWNNAGQLKPDRLSLEERHTNANLRSGGRA